MFTRKIFQEFGSPSKSTSKNHGRLRGVWAGWVTVCAIAGLGTAALADGYLIVPWVQNVAVDPETVSGGGSFHLVAKVIDLGGGIGQVDLDLTSLGGPARQLLYDDGNPAHGDRFPGDGVYSLIATVPLDWMPGSYGLEVRGYSIPDGDFTSATCQLTVIGGMPLLQVQDQGADDHGPNQDGVSHLYYTYPTHVGFVPEAFDLLELAVRRVQVDLGNGSEERLAFQVRVGDFPDPSVPGNVDWEPYFADLNLQKIDIVIDAEPGGATASLPWRGAGYQPWNGWEYAIIIDGWYKAVVPSLGSNDFIDWQNNALITDADIVLAGDFESDTITALVAPPALGNPTDSDVIHWNICVQLAGHDFGGAEVFGGIRWVQAAPTEWLFGGGSDSDRDANLMDLLLVPGVGASPGRPQEYLLDYESPEAYDRLALGLTPVAIEVTARGLSDVTRSRGGGPVLAQNSPNPFNPSTTISFELASPREVSLGVFDLAGRLVKTLISGEWRDTGRHFAEWNGRDAAGQPAAAGVYFYRLQAGSFAETKRMLLLK